MSNRNSVEDPETQVQENREVIIEIIKHGGDQYIRALCLAALVKYGDDPDINRLKEEVSRLDQMEEELR